MPNPSPSVQPAGAAIVTTCERGVDTDRVGPALERLYGNVYATVHNFTLESGLDDCYTYTVRRGEELLTLLVFRLRKRRAEVLNEVIALGTEEIDAFARHVFAHCAEVDVVACRAVETPRYRGPYPCQQYDYLEDSMLMLPSSVAAYSESLSKNTRRSIKRQERDAQNELQGYAFQALDPEHFTDEQVREVIGLNHERMAGKNKQSGFDDAAERRLVALARASGLLGVITVDGKVCAGTLACRAGDNYFLLVLAHRNAYNQYGIGFLCCYHTICACIERGGNELHFLWGRYDYKRSFLGQWRNLDRVLLYRSRWAALRHAGLAWRAWRQARQRRLMLWLRERSHEPTPLFSMAFAVLQRLRGWRHQWRQRSLMP
ncbi:GNAT family N-acetyltransferase [Pseudoduganella namucuonensis]|uniref:Acetyltransferase (GNAT) domain-containing protein n=1 Tax=Pseudoduganella namucuonensis TaxID=1035707 RepID=A0A1I7K2V5_9BURK|nr:GNAT family N-acetyltransferase [Pseudoduganella namucuonensis]SFU91710.1 Acetyltransferase (GNAT) domain-containing protein [Pseudoduganella namucuonensis]